ncbi:hypothetical protein [Alysiella crassa]|nr:hypothetical protein [Alysiella crassa]
MAKNIIFGYARVSTTDQNLDSQKALLIKASVGWATRCPCRSIRYT